MIEYILPYRGNYQYLPPPKEEILITSKEPHHVYKAFDSMGCLLYVGVTYDLKSRMKNHRNSSPWYHEVVYIEVRKYPNRITARLAEYQVIMDEFPIYNQQKAQGIFWAFRNGAFGFYLYPRGTK